MKRLVSVFLLIACIAMVFGSSDALAAGPRLKHLVKAINDGNTWSIVNGLRVFPKGNRIFVKLDTLNSGLSGTAAWTITVPSGSTAVLDSSNKLITSFKADTVGFYYLTVTYSTATVKDTVYASTFVGVPDLTTPGCADCHDVGSDQDVAYQAWKNTGHAQIFRQGMSGQLELVAYVNASGKTVTQGSYGKNCIQCHTIGWEPTKNNGNFGYVAHTTVADTSLVSNPGQKGWDSTWYAGLVATSATGLSIPTDTGMARWKAMPATLQGLGSIGCESCHGPLAGHLGSGTNRVAKVAKSNESDVCNLCHNGSTRHTLGAYYNLSGHALEPNDAARSSCAPCHQGESFVLWTKRNKDTTGWAGKLTDDQLHTQIACQTCHDPHKAATITGKDASGNPVLDPGLRQVSVDSLRNGFKFKPAGTSQVCSYCHSSRYSVTGRVKPASGPYYGFTSRFGPHENPQFDMFVGSNAYQFGDTTFTGINTHGGLENGCVTCHMQERVRVTNPATGATNNNPQANHSMKMVGDTAWGFNAMKVCADCHGEVADPNDVKAFYDFDRNGKIEGVQSEVSGLLTQLKAILPKDTTGEVIGLGTVTKADSAKINGRLDLVAGIYNYRFVTNDGSLGIHNAAYAVRLLYKSLGWTPLWVKDYAGTTPTEFKLEQNYPNPFNPSTVIRFSLPKESRVRLDVYDVTGQLVKSLLNEGVRAGNKEVTWNGTNNSGMKVASGVYIYRLQADNFVTAKKMLLVK